MKRSTYVWFISITAWIFGGLWLASLLSEPKRSHKDAAEAEVQEAQSPQLELESRDQVEQINNDQFKPWTASSR